MGYLENAACNGRRPKKIGPQRIYSRPRLVKRLVAERDVARFVVAPSGFGKTSLGLEYAASMFSFRGVHWLDCSSPCFLRDLDAGIIAKTLIARPAQLDLVVFDDVPFLADARSECFSHEIDALLEAGCEVLVTTTPAFGAIADAQRDCVIVGARDLLVDDCELSSSHVASVEGLRECDRVPAFLWGGQDGMREFLRGMRLGEMPSEMRAPVFVMEALQVGSFDDLSAVSGGVRADARRFISEHYPYVGVDLADETFEAHGFDVAQVMEGLGESIDSLGRVATPSARDALSAKVACMLAARGMGPRACEIMQIACARKRRISWILQQQWHLFDSGCVRPLQELFESLGARSTGLDASMVAAASGRLFVLGEKERASSVARCALGMRGISSTDALMCALVALDAGGESARSAALETLGNIAAGKVEVLANDALAGRIAVSAIALHKGDVAAACRALRNAGVDTHVLRTATVYCATLLRRVFRRANGEDLAMVLSVSRALVNRMVDSTEEATVCEAILVAAVVESGGDAPLSSARQRACDVLAAGLAEQRRGRTRPSLVPAQMPLSDCAMQSPRPAVIPEMRVNIFGGMEVTIGGVAVDPHLFAKQRTKTLLAVLVLFRGKEIARPELLRIMWPDATPERATNNFYSLWCRLRRALGAEHDEDCPYLVRHRASVMVDTRYVKSDVDEFDALCRTLLFDEPNARAWLAVFEKMEESFSCDLLPSETENAFIAAMRLKYRARRIDAYVSAALRLVDAGEADTALWFAEVAADACPGREDAAFALMRAQAASGQRVQAMETYRLCAKHLAEELGIDPGDRMREMYCELLNGKEPMQKSAE